MHRMKFVGKSESAEFYFAELATPYRWNITPFDGRPYACLIVNFDKAMEKHANMAIGAIERQLIVSGCKRIHCAGEHCFIWEDIADWTVMEIEGKLDKTPPEPERDLNVMTAWFDGDEPAEIIDAFARCDEFSDQQLPERLILFVGQNEPVKRQYLDSLDRILTTS